MPANATLTVNLQASPTVAGGPAPRPYQPTMADFMARPQGFAAFTPREIMAGFTTPPPAPAAALPPAPARNFFQPASPEARQSAAFASMGLGMAGFHGAAAVTGGYAAMGPVGAALAAIDQFGKQLKEIADNILKPMVSLDSEQVARGFNSLVSKIPVVGNLLGGLGGAILDLGDAIEATARRLSEYSPELAFEMATIEIRKIQGDIERARRFGPQMAQAVEQRFEFEQRLLEIVDENLPDILSLLQAALPLLEGIFQALAAAGRIAKEAPTDIAAGFSGIMVGLNELIGNVPGGEFWMGVLEQLGIMARNSTPPVSNIIAGVDIRTIMNNIQTDRNVPIPMPVPRFNPPPAFMP